MFVRTAEKRLSLRVSAAYPVKIHDGRGALLTGGRTANTSEHGLLAVVRRVVLPKDIVVEISLPSLTGSTRVRGLTRTVIYRARVVRQLVLGNLMGVGVQLIEKVQ